MNLRIIYKYLIMIYLYDKMLKTFFVYEYYISLQVY